MRKSAAGVAGLITVLLLTGATSNSCSSTGGGVSSDDLNKQTAIGACEKSVEKQLKAPSTADYANERARKVGNDQYNVSGDVDAENSFGAKLRTHWSGVATTRNGGDTWRCLATLDE